MDTNVIYATLSTQDLTYRLGGSPASFEVTVRNDSEQFANFQIEVSAGIEENSPGYTWYKLSPEGGAGKPAGGSTTFTVSIINTPSPGLTTTMLTVKVFSPELREERRLPLRLKIEADNSLTLLNVELPVRKHQVYPLNCVDIPVRVRNLGQRPVNVMLKFIGIDPSWLKGSAERHLTSVAPGEHKETTFQCQPPSVLQAPSQIYPFSVETISYGSPASAQGSLEVLPIGFVQFIITQKQQKIPNKSRWLIDWKSDSARFALLFKNASNLRQEINLTIQGRDWRKCAIRKFPETADLNLGETTTVILDVRTKRPWIGIRKNLLLEAKAELSDKRLGSTDPTTQTLELQVLPIIPLWLQLAIIALLAALLAFFLQPRVMHTASVNAVQFNGDGTSVVSGSNDGTLRRWRIDGNSLEPEGKYTESSSVALGVNHKREGLLAIPNQSVNVLRIMPVDSNRVAAGLHNGIIQLWYVPTGELQEELKDKNDLTADRIFDLVFQQESSYLFSGHGSGKVRIWSRKSANSDFQLDPKQPSIDLQQQLQLNQFQVRALTLSPDQKTLVIGGNFKRFVLWEWQQKLPSFRVQRLKLLEKKFDDGPNDKIWALAFAPNSSEILATSDSHGFITIWDLSNCESIPAQSQENQFIEVSCSTVAHWSTENKAAVRSLAFTDDGRRLISGGEDGKVIVWHLTSEYHRDETKSPEVKYTSSKTINSVDLKRTNQGTMIVSGGEDFQVKLHRIK
jgi:WD40 repeat protein